MPALACLLGNAARLGRVTRFCAWNACGSGAVEAVGMFVRQARALGDAEDRLAACIVFLGGVARADEGECVVSEPTDVSDREILSADRLAALLCQGHERSMLSLAAASDLAADLDDRATESLLAEQLIEHRRHVVELRRVREGSPGAAVRRSHTASGTARNDGPHR